MRLIFILLLTFPIVSALAAKELTIESEWKSNPIVIDGNDSEWTGNFAQIPDYDECCMSVQNDCANLYICIRSTDDITNSQIIMTGFAVTFKGIHKGKDLILGVQFPTGIHTIRNSFTGNEIKNDPEMYKALEEQMLQSLSIIGPGKDDIKPMGIGIADSFGVKARCTHQKDKLIYELNMPLKKGTPVIGDIDIVRKSLVKISMETIPPDFNAEKDHRNRSGGINGRPHHNGNGMGGVMGGNQSDNALGRREPGWKKIGRFDPFKSSVTVKLSSFISEK